LESKVQSLTAEVNHLRLQRENVALLREEKIGLEHALTQVQDIKKRNIALEAENIQLCADAARWSVPLARLDSSLDTPQKVVNAMIEARQALLLLKDQHGALLAQVKGDEIRAGDRERLLVEALSNVSTCKARLALKEQEVDGLKRNQALLLQEVASLQSTLASYDLEEKEMHEGYDTSKQTRIAALEAQVEAYRQRMTQLEKPAAAIQPSPSLDTLSFVQLRDKERQLNAEIVSLKSQVLELQSQLATAQAQLRIFSTR